MSSPSRFIVVTGANGVGKTTAARGLADALPAALLRYSDGFRRFRDYGRLDTEVLPKARFLYYLAATVELSAVVDERLRDGHVVCDRYLESPASLVRAESNLSGTDIGELGAPFEPWIRRPDLTVVLTAGYEAARERILRRGSAAVGLETLSRVQRRTLESAEFFREREGMLRLEAARLGPVAELHTSSLSEAEMCAAVVRTVREAFDLGSAGGGSG